MRTYQTLIAVAVIATLSGCASTPNAVIATPTATAPLAAPPATVALNIPAWYIQTPDSTTEAVYVSGTAISRDLSMSHHKAKLDAETHLANKIAGEIRTMTKDYKRDVGDQFVQSTEIVSNKIAADVLLVGGIVVNHQIIAEGGGFRTYVLLKFPLGNSNQMLQTYLNKKSFTGSKNAAEAELKERAEDSRQRDATPTPVTVVTPKVTRVTPDNSGLVIKETISSN